MTTRELRRIGKQWQKRLGLESWEISYSFVDLEGLLGTASWVASRQWAQVQVQKDLCRGPMNGDTVEGTVVHELLHIRLQGHEEKTRKDGTALEIALDRIEEALVKGWGQEGTTG